MLTDMGGHHAHHLTHPPDDHRVRPGRGRVRLRSQAPAPLPGRPGRPDHHRGGAKPFTFASGDRSGRISIATTLHSGSRFKRALADLTPGRRVLAAGAIGTRPAVDPSQSQVLVAQGTGITPFLSMARSHASLNAALLQAGTPHFFDEAAAATTSAAGQHDHREGLQDAVRQAIADRPAARWSLSGRPDFAAAVARQLAGAAVPARMIHKDAFRGMRAPAPAPARRRDLVNA